MSAKKPARVVLALALLTGAGTLAWAVSTGRLDKDHRDDRELTIYGNVEVRQAELAFRVPGRLELMELDEGQVVHEGDALARLDTRTFDDDVSAAEATLAAQEAVLQKLVAGPRPAEIARARAMVAEASAGVKNANPDFARTERLFEEGVLAQATLEDARAAKQAADARLFSANESLRLLVEGSREEDIAMAEANVRAARARLSAARNARADAELFAPSDGVVISRVREPGSIVSPNDIV
ncbi:MAG: biotin/lipoyl-binding protein, partial [Myxococcales bacterium]|nr:biotin/lipoyl-binding protein [Myxococcales bacterium]